MSEGNKGTYPVTIGVVLASPGDQRLLSRVLGERYHLVDVLVGSDNRNNTEFDLAIVDPVTLKRERAMLEQARRNAGETILPVLLLVEPSRSSSIRVLAELGHVVDDIIRMPTTAPELHSRTENLLRLRRLSLALQARLHSTDQALRGTAHALNVLRERNDVLVGAQTEEELLSRICYTITEQDGYDLAWVGFANSDTNSAIYISASAGSASAYIDKRRVDRELYGEGPAWRAIIEGKAQTVMDLTDEADIKTELQPHCQHQLHSLSALPIRPAGTPAGVLVVYSSDPSDFGPKACQLLETLARNLEYGLEALHAGSERERQRVEIEQMAYTDSLTGLPNRSHLLLRLEELLSGAGGERHIGVLFLDLDSFKLINDALGHISGDRVLRQAAQRLASVIRPEDILARQGGDEFIVVMTEDSRRGEKTDSTSSAKTATRLATRLAQKIQEPMIVEGYERRIGVSIGIAMSPEHGVTANDLLARADVAMYAAKARSEPVAMYSSDIYKERHRRLTLESRLAYAFENEQLKLYYQPVFDLETTAIKSVEVLLRWPQDDGTMISPGEFIPILEDTELILPVGNWVLETAACQLAQWLEQGLDLDVAVNLSVLQLESEDRIDDMVERVSRHGPSNRMCLEITEGSLSGNADIVEANLRTLHRQNFRIAIDDFGTGYSSLSRLQSLPIDTLKIDKSFVDELEYGGRGAIARAVCQLADSLEMSTIAEGIETDTQRRRLLEMGCDWGQGFWCSPAVPPDQLPSLVHRSREK